MYYENGKNTTCLTSSLYKQDVTSKFFLFVEKLSDVLNITSFKYPSVAEGILDFRSAFVKGILTYP